MLEAAASEGFSFHDRDVVGVTEAVVAKAQGNYASTDDIAEDVRSKFGDHPIGVIFPILSRNRFAICLRGIARGAKKIVLMFSYPSDEVGNTLVSEEKLEAAGVNPWADVLDEKRYRALFGENKHLFTGVDYVEYYASLIREEGADVEILFANRPTAVLDHTKHVLCCDIHTRERTKRLLRAAGAETVYGLDDILSAPVNGSGFNADYGLLGSNKSTESRVKLFPRDCAAFAHDLQRKLSEATGRQIEALVYGDGAFRDPVGKIWELADPVVSPGFTEGLQRPAQRGQAQIPRGQPIPRPLGQRAQAGRLRVHPQQKGRPQGHDGDAGHHSPPPDRPDRQPVRPDERQRRQGHAHRPHPGIFRQFRRLEKPAGTARAVPAFFFL